VRDVTANTILYYPGCTVKRSEQNFENTSLAVLDAVDVKVFELPKWYCCGALHSMALDNLIKHIGSIRTLAVAEEYGSKLGTRKLLTICPLCFNVLKRVNALLKNNPDKLDTVNQYLRDENLEYKLSIEVIHVVGILREIVDKIGEKIVRKPGETPVTTYYGCMLVRPREIGLDNPENPTVIENILQKLGFNVVDNPLKTLCCGSYHILYKPDIVFGNSAKILKRIPPRARLVVTACPLCRYNLSKALESAGRSGELRVVYLTEVIAYVLGLDNAIPPDTLDFLHKALQPSPK